MHWKENSRDMRAKIREMNKLIPETAAGFSTLGKAVKDNGTLDVKTKEFLALAISISERCEPCIGFHVEALIRAGGSRDELADVLGMNIQMGGGPALMYAAKALEAWGQMVAE
ncbi:MAG: carboxymuconolactone decarboxylase family protein [Marinosulfonomonas sp.]|nr:carboxymuconolactone decarboxylase family protein [Marinosulfonomonas sp.]